ncbi:hypothetical protein QQ045_027459 [Rhodiola kirilowii]
MVHPQKIKKKQSMVATAIDSRAMTMLQSTLSTTERYRSSSHVDDKFHLGNKYEIGVGNEKSSSSHRRAVPAHLPAIEISQYLGAILVGMESMPWTIEAKQDYGLQLVKEAKHI